uniref:Uncharacterized protein n=1 Tax=Panagrolaimus sp. ES5 TaxID=591445 RepID=A0AC34FSS8_9BILA
MLDSPFPSKSITNDNKQIETLDFGDSTGKGLSLNSWNKSSKRLSSSFSNINRDPEEHDEFQKAKSINKSTLSLHNAAYESAFEVANNSTDSEIQHLTDKSENSSLHKTLDTAKQRISGTSSTNQNSFEFPRQQSDKPSEPEIMQFKASQKLLDPNARISRADISKFYNSLTPEQKVFFTKYQEEHQQIEKNLAKTQLLLHEERKEKLGNAMKIKAVNVQKETENETTKKLNININAEISNGTSLSNEIYYALIKQIPQPSQRRKKILQIFGLSNHENDLTVLSTKFLYKFDEKFEQSRKIAGKNGTLIEFNKETVLFPNDKLPLANEKQPFENHSSTVTKETTIFDSEMVDESDDRDMPLLEAMDVTEPAMKKSRQEAYPFNSPKTVDSKCQTDLELKHLLELEGSKRKLKNLNEKIRYHKKKSANLKEHNNEYENFVVELQEDCIELDEEIDQLELFREENVKLKQEVRERDEMILELNDQLDNYKKGNKFYLKNTSGKFSVEAHTCFSRLLSQGNVAQDKVPIVILVVADLFKISVDAVPSRWTVGRDIHMVHSLNCEYIVMILNECKNLSYLSDETTKFTKKLQGTVLTGKNDKTHQNFVLHIGVTEVPSKSAERCLQEFKQTLSNIARIGGFNVEEFIKNIVINIRNLMGDQAATTKLLYNLFMAYRSHFLGNSDFDEATKASLQRVNTSFFMLHILSNSSDIVFKSLLDHEKYSTNTEEITGATVLWVINEVARYFSKRSSGKHSSAGQWETLAKEMELKFFKIDSNLGHRFIIRFIIASEIIYNREEIIAVLEYLGNTDETLQDIKKALQNDLIVLHLHILALLGALILHPMWQLCEASESILQMALYAPALINYLKDLIEDPMLIFTFTSPFDAFPSAAPKENSKASAFLKSLKERSIPVGGSEVVPFVAKSLLEYFERQLDPFLTGIYASPDIALEKETAGAPLTNMPCEAQFGITDYFFTTKPNMTTYNKSALVVQAKNQTFEYIAKLPEEKQREMYLKAMNNKKLSAKLAAEKTQQIHRENVEKIEQQALKQANDKKKKEAKRKNIAADLRDSGFWLTVPEMDEALLNIPQTTAIKHVKANIRFRKTVWTPKFQPKNLLQFSYKGHNYTYPELVANLKAVIVADFFLPMIQKKIMLPILKKINYIIFKFHNDLINKI